MAAARTGWKTGKPLEEKPAGLAPSRSSRLKKQRERKSRRPCAVPAAFVAGVFDGLPNPITLFLRDGAQYIYEGTTIDAKGPYIGLVTADTCPSLIEFFHAATQSSFGSGQAFSQ